jgi:methylenetetrahydrofolate/methylenetetrahydromethanopterin dehydrogenase (NADP+)
MSSRPKILLQLDTDALPSTFDSVVAIDAGVDHLLRQGGVTLDNVVGLVHGAMFTRGPSDLHRTAIFLGGSDVQLAEQVAERIAHTLFDPLRVSVMLDPSGANTTAVAAVLSVEKHHPVAGSRCAVLGASGPVGRRVARLLLRGGASVDLYSRSETRAAQVQSSLAEAGCDTALCTPLSLSMLAERLPQTEVVIACGAAGVQLVSAEQFPAAERLVVAVDLNAVPPAGLAGISVTDKAKLRGNRIDYGALGVGGLKMRIHKQALSTLFESNQLRLDIDELYTLGAKLLATGAK